MTLRPFRCRGANIADKFTPTHVHTRKPRISPNVWILLKFCTRKCDFFLVANFTTNVQYFPLYEKSHHLRPTPSKTHPQLTGPQMSEFRTSTARGLLTNCDAPLIATCQIDNQPHISTTNNQILVLQFPKNLRKVPYETREPCCTAEPSRRISSNVLILNSCVCDS